MRLAVIPARGGSKRIPRKNVKPFAGKPMIAWSIEAAINSNCFDRIIVTTEDEEIAVIARSLGAETPFMRPVELADDHTPTIPVVAHAIEWHRQHGMPPGEVCCIYATAPFLASTDLQQGLTLLHSSVCDYVFSVTSYAFPIQRAIRITAGNQVEMIDATQFNTRSQDLEEAFHDAGQFYWGTSAAWLSGKPIFSAGARPVILPRHRVQDIDTVEDWERAEWMFKAMHHKGSQA